MAKYPKMLAIMPIAAIAMMMKQSGQSAIDAASKSNSKLFAVYIVVLVATALFTYLTWRSGNHLQDVITTDANARIEEAKSTAAQAAERTETLRQENLILQAQVLKLQARTEFRHLTLSQQRAISDKLRVFGGTTFGMYIYNAGDDATTLGNNITSALTNAEWKSVVSAGSSGGPPKIGVVVEFSPAVGRRSIDAANSLAKALREEGLFVPPVTKFQPDPSMGLMGFDHTDIVISIQRKP